MLLSCVRLWAIYAPDFSAKTAGLHLSDQVLSDKFRSENEATEK
jgi:hypothetical protein